MATRDEFVQKAIAAGLTDPGKLKAAMEERRRTVGAFDDEAQEQLPPEPTPQPTQQPQRQQEPSYLERNIQTYTKDLPEAAQGVWNRFVDRNRRVEAPTTLGAMAQKATGTNGALGQLVEGVAGMPERITRTAAGAVGTIGDVAGTAFGLGLKNVNNISGGNISKAAGKGMNAVAKVMPGTADAFSFMAQKAKEYGGHLQEWYDQQPEADRANLAAAIDLTEAFGIIPGGKAALKNSVKYVDDVARQSTEQFAPKAMKALQKTDDAIDLGWDKGIKPKVNGKKTFARMDAAAEYNKEAVKTIVGLKDQLNIVDDAGERVIVPRNAAEYAQALPQAKSIIWKRANDMTKAATGKGATYDANDLVNELVRVSEDVASGATPERRAIAKAMIPEIQELHGMPLETVEKRISEYNEMLSPHYNNPQPYSRNAVTANIVVHLRKNLDDAISRFEGPGYQKLKNQYGALKAVESEVNHRAIVNARRAKNSVVDFTDVFTSGETIAGIMTGNGPLIVKGMVGRAIKEGIKAQNNPERYVKKMFRAADNLSSNGQPLRGGVEHTLRQHETPPLTGPRRITDEGQLLTYQMLGGGAEPRVISGVSKDYEIPVGAKIRNLGDKGVIDPKTANGRLTLPSPDDIWAQYAGTDYPQQFGLGNRTYHPKAERLNPARQIEYRPGEAETVDMIGPRKQLPQTIEIGKAIEPGTTSPVKYADAEKLMQDKGTIGEIMKLVKEIPQRDLTPDQAARVDDFLKWYDKFDKSDNLRAKGYRKKGMTKIGDILNRK